MASSQLRIIFMGTPDFAVPSLRVLIENKEHVIAVVTQPDRPKGRGRKLTSPPIKLLAQQTGIAVLQPTKIKTDAFLGELNSYQPDVILVAAYGRILPPQVLTLPRLGCINVHGSILPKYRGAAPIQTAILRGEREAGVTIMQMDSGLDTGDMLLGGSLPISEQDTSATLIPRLAELGGSLLHQALLLLAAGRLEPKKQDDSQATLAPPLTKEDGLIRWQDTAFAISCQIRALDPWPTAYTWYQGRQIKFFSPMVEENDNPGQAGMIISADKNGLVIACGQNQIRVSEIQADGGKRMPVHSFLLGHPFPAGTALG